MLIGSFGADSSFGVAWSLLHLIETAPMPVVAAEPPAGANEWLARLWLRYDNRLADQAAATPGGEPFPRCGAPRPASDTPPE
ncbi:hypothetical protein [Streptodolium elevatio]|uniref:Uncharacterized protein n=1 Tax=Streptodolium elevatio TaxID=3157996 RepID=A0ABV3DW04_9ACTN